jgi:predicted membrane-bound spermidine synthase
MPPPTAFLLKRPCLSDIARPTVLVLFFFSGATALVYEVVWSKYLTLLFGSTVQAQTVVLAVFMTGLAIGSRWLGSRSLHLHRPLRSYALLEIGIGFYGLLFPWLYDVADGVFISLGNGLLPHTTRLLLLKGALSVGLLLIPTILMGGTLPLIASWLQQPDRESGRWVARFYSINTLGACLGAGLTGFWLLRSLGMSMTLCLTAPVNCLAGFIAWGLDRMQVDSSEPPPAVPVAPEPSKRFQPDFAWGCGVVALTGGVSLGLEVLASRILSLLFGASLPAFGAMLMSFILGIGLGSAAISSSRFKSFSARQTVPFLLLATAVFLGALTLGIETWTKLYLEARRGLAQNPMGYHFHLLLTLLTSMGVLGIPAALLGATLPWWMRDVGETGSVFGDRVGWLLSWNTIGAVTGSLLMGFVLMPVIGLRGALGSIAVLLGLAAIILAIRERRRMTAWTSAVLTAALILVALLGSPDWQLVMSAGLFRQPDPRVTLEMVYADRKQNIRLLFYEDAADATVSVEQDLSLEKGKMISLRINGKTDASSGRDLSTQYLLAHLPMLARPESKDVFVLGLGSGITAGAFLGHPIEHLTIAENCAPVLKAAEFFSPWNHQVLTNPRSRVWREDARTVLKLDSSQYDIIVSEPSNPWVAAVGGVFNREFYELAAQRLKDGGIMAQWFHVYEMDDLLVRLVLRTFHSVFPVMEIWDSHTGDIILLGSRKAWPSSPETYRKGFERQGLWDDLGRFALNSPEAIWSRQLASQSTAFAIPDPGLIQTDERPILEYDAPRAFFIGGVSHLLWHFDERSAQVAIAPKAKRQVLASLSARAVSDIFQAVPSINGDLSTILRRRLNGTENSFRNDPFSDLSSAPCIFLPRTQPASPGKPPIPPGASETLKRLLEAEALIRNVPGRWQEGVDVIEQTLLQSGGTTPSETVRWSSSFFTVRAIQASLDHGDRDRAYRLLTLGLRLDPHAAQLKYFARILIDAK